MANRLVRTWAPLSALLIAIAPAAAQRHTGLSSPPTAPPTPNRTAVPQPIAPVSSGLGVIQFFPVNYGTAAPQSLTRQLSAEDERTRVSALAALGVPSEYTARGRVPFARTVQLELAPLSSNADTDAVLTVELDHHIVTAVLMPVNGEWRRIATVLFPTATADPATTPSTFQRITRSVTEPNRYRAVFHARELLAGGDYIEYEAHLRIHNNRAIITTSFISDQRQCLSAPAGGKVLSCAITSRWLQPDPGQPTARRFDLVSASGTLSAKDAANPLSASRDFQVAHLRHYTCQPFTFSEGSLRYEPTGPATACKPH